MQVEPNNHPSKAKKLVDSFLISFLCLLISAIITYILVGKLHSPHLTLEDKRVEEIKGWLEKYNKYPSFTPPASDREFWDKIANKPPKKKPVYDERLLDRIEEGVEQECAYGTGEWIPLIEENIEIALTCNLRLEEFEGKVDISLATWAGALSHAIAMVGDKLNPSLVLKTKAYLQREVIEPFMQDTKKAQSQVLSWEEDACPWLNTKTNWTAVCVAYIVYTALIIEDDVEKQAKIIARAEQEMKDHLATFGSKGYIPSGMRYWSYGFRNFVLIAERLLHATGGNINLYDNEIAPYAAMFVFNYTLRDSNVSNVKQENQDGTPRFYPNFGDNSNPIPLEAASLNLLANRIDIPWKIQNDVFTSETSHFSGALQIANYVVEDIPYKSPKKFERTDFWESGGVALTYSRDQNPLFALATKGGNNNEDHNHNDLGSYVLFKKPEEAQAWQWIAGDPENITYRPGYFGTDRYQFPIASSWGHPLPSVNNQLQSEGVMSQAHILHYEDDGEKTIIIYELKSAYRVQGLKNLIRVIYWEKVGPALLVLDYANAQGLGSFSTALISNEDLKLSSQDKNTLLGDFKTSGLRVVAHSPEGLEISRDEFKEAKLDYKRTSLECVNPKNNPWVYYQLSPSSEEAPSDKSIKENIQKLLNLAKEYGQIVEEKNPNN